jgi:hypothetical protein
MGTSLKCQLRPTTARRVLFVLIAALVTFQGAPTPTGATTRWSDADAERVSDAERLFDRRGLRLPPVTIEFHDDDDACKGHPGYFRPRLERIDICSDLPFVLIHELAHVWIEDHVRVAARRAFVSRNDLPTWNDHDHEWDDRGVELAAFTIQQVVMRDLDPRRSSTRELLANFNFLTRTTSPTTGPF